MVSHVPIARWQSSGEFPSRSTPELTATAYKIDSRLERLTPFPFNLHQWLSTRTFRLREQTATFTESLAAVALTVSASVYKMTPAGKISVLHDFAGYPSDGNIPVGHPGTRQRRQLLWQRPTMADPSNAGTLFKISASGAFTFLLQLHRVGRLVTEPFRTLA